MKIKALVTAALCALMLASCSDGEDSSSKSKKDKSEADTSSVSSVTSDDSDDSKGDDTSSEDESSEDESSEDESSKDESSKDESSASSKPDDDSSAVSVNDGKVYDPGLVKLAKEMYSAKEFTGNGDEIEDKCIEAYDKAGVLSICANLKSEELFDPFDDLIENESLIAAKCPDAQVFILAEVFEFEEDGETDIDNDGFVFSVAYGCKDTAAAKELLKLVVSEESIKELEENPKDGIKFESKDNGDTAWFIGNNNDEMLAGYYRIGSNVFAIGYYNMQWDPEDYPEGVKPKYDYKAELDKICKKLGVKSPTELK